MRRRVLNGEVTKPRKINLADREWLEIGRMARDRRVSHSRYIAECVLSKKGSRVAAPEMVELLEETRLVLDKTSTFVTEARDTLPTFDVLHVCVSLGRLERRLFQALDRCDGRADRASQHDGSG